MPPAPAPSTSSSTSAASATASSVAAPQPAAASAAATPGPVTLSPGPVTLTGTVYKIHFRAPETAYTVLKVHATHDEAAGGGPRQSTKSRRQLYTVVGTLPQVSLGGTYPCLTL